jgi:hypothetical protein
MVLHRIAATKKTIAESPSNSFLESIIYLNAIRFFLEDQTIILGQSESGIDLAKLGAGCDIRTHA